jgi:hypothetical protein
MKPDGILQQRRLYMRLTNKRLLASRTAVLLSLFALFLLMGPPPAASQFLHGSDKEGRMYFININTGTGTYICDLPTHPDPGVTEIEFDFVALRGVLQTRDGIFSNQLIDVFNCAPITGQVYSGWAFNGLEYVGQQLRIVQSDDPLPGQRHDDPDWTNG